MTGETEDGNSNSALALPAWAHACGILDLKESRRPVNSDEAVDRLLCMERIARYCWAYDERRLDALEGCFTDDAIWEGNVLGRIPIGPFVGHVKIGNWLSGFWPHQRDQRRHMLLNTIIEEQTAESVLTLSYLQLLSSDSKRVQLETTGFYRVMHQRAGEQWKISRLTAGFDAPFWPGNIDTMSVSGRARHGVSPVKS